MANPFKKLLQKIDNDEAGTFSLDLRGLAIFRIGLGLVVLIDLVLRAPDIQFFYTEQGVLPKSSWLIHGHHFFWDFSLHALYDTYSWQVFLFIAQAIFAILMILGWRTRLFSFLTWLLVVSLQNRFDAMLSGADSLLRVMLFWSILLPVGSVFSLDAKKGKYRYWPDFTFSNYRAMAFTLQVAALYLFAFILKNDDLWFVEGSAVKYALRTNDIIRPAAMWLWPFDGVLYFFSIATMILEGGAGLLIAVPLFNKPLIRIIVVSALSFMHLSFLLFLDIGIFPLINMVALIPLLPRMVWDKITLPGLSAWQQRHVALSAKWKTKVIEGLAVFFIALVIYENYDNLDNKKQLPLFFKVKPMVMIFQLNQKWSMFSTPRDYANWYNISVKKSGNNGFEPLSNNYWNSYQERPADGTKMYKNNRVRKYIGNIEEDGHRGELLGFADYVCRKNPTADSVKIDYFKQPYELGGGYKEVEKETLITKCCSCF